MSWCYPSEVRCVAQARVEPELFDQAPGASATGRTSSLLCYREQRAVIARAGMPGPNGSKSPQRAAVLSDGVLNWLTLWR
jgi:hypothetical protein